MRPRRGPSCSKTWPRSRQSIQPPQAGHYNRRGQRSALQVCHRDLAVRLSALEKRGGIRRGDLCVAVGTRLAVHQDFKLAPLCIKLLTLRACRCGNGIDLSGIGTWVVKDRFAHAEATDTKRTRSTTGKGRAGPFGEPTRTSRCPSLQQRAPLFSIRLAHAFQASQLF